jgi:hypothetical protein
LPSRLQERRGPAPPFAATTVRIDPPLRNNGWGVFTALAFPALADATLSPSPFRTGVLHRATIVLSTYSALEVDSRSAHGVS